MKCRIIASGKPAVNADGTLAYSVLQQGTGLVDAERAVYGTANNCANQGLNINADLAGTQHYMGSVRSAPTAPSRCLVRMARCSNKGYIWDRRLRLDRRLLSGPMATSGPTAYLWTDGYVRAARGFDIPWVGGYPADHRHLGGHRHQHVDQLLGDTRVVRRRPQTGGRTRLSFSRSFASQGWCLGTSTCTDFTTVFPERVECLRRRSCRRDRLPCGSRSARNSTVRSSTITMSGPWGGSDSGSLLVTFTMRANGQ